MIRNINSGTRNLKNVGEDIKMELQINLACLAYDDVIIYMKIAVNLDNKIIEYGHCSKNWINRLINPIR